MSFVRYTLIAALCAVGCGDDDEKSTTPTAGATIEPRSGSELAGMAVVTPKAKGATISITLQNAPPGTHAVHIHAMGDCGPDDGDAMAAGGHWNPTDEEHGMFEGERSHRGDLGNMEVDEDGNGTLERTSDEWTVGDGEVDTDVVGHAIVIHEKVDDWSQPTGNAGGRIGCGVLE
jgi:superoxide dismutase, Cu-Zn family